ncbi:MAG: L-dopachrome tautomerase-related protein [Nevskia sp.]
MILRLLRRLVAGLLFLVVLALVGIKLRYGGGADFPDRSTPPKREPTALEIVAELPTPPGNIAVSAEGRVFFTLHPEARPELKLVEWVAGKAVPWPSAAFQDAHQGEPRWFRNVLGIRIDAQNRLWTLDNGEHGLHAARLLAFDLASGAVVHDYAFPRRLAGIGSHLNDFQVSPDGTKIFIADASFFGRTPALIVYDTETRKARRLLEGHPSVTPDKYTPVIQGQRMEIYGLLSIRPGVDSIALDHRGEWLYFAPVTSLNLYRARTVDLLDASLSPAQLAGRIEVFAPKTMSDGLSMDNADNLYLSDLEHSAIVLLHPDKTLQTLVRDEQRLRWPDGFSFGADGWLYVSCSSLQRVFGRSAAQIAAGGPYQVLRIKAEAEGVPGH